MDPLTTPTNPYLAGAYAPTAEEHGPLELVVEGELPAGLEGAYVRNGPNPKFAPGGLYHWFDGDGMVHGVTIRDGRVTYRNRWLRTAGLAHDEAEGRACWTGLMEPTRDNPRGRPYKDTANTDLAFHAGRLIASWYVAGRPLRVDAETLETLGELELGAAPGASRPLNMSAHMKVDEATGELMFFDYGPRPPYMSYGVLAPDGKLAHLVAIDLPGPRLPHDMAITERHSVLMDLPVFFRPEALRVGKWMVDYHRDLPARFGILPRYGAGESVRWFEAEPCYVYHVVNAWEEGDEVVMVGCRVTDPLPAARAEDGEYARMMANLRLSARLYRWRFDLRTGAVREGELDHVNTDFPSIDGRFAGRRTRRSFNMRIDNASTLRFDGVVAYDTDDGSARTWELGAGRYASEASFAPVGEGEGEGYLLTFVHDARDGSAELQILDARDVAAGPVARAAIPCRVPAGFHATWVPGAALWGPSSAP